MGYSAVRNDAYNKDMPRHVLYMSYDGLLDPLGNSQILPYIRGLAENGYRLTVISYEKTGHDAADIHGLRKELSALNVAWIHLPFRKGRFHGLIRILKGAIVVRQIAKQDPYSFVHLRTILTAVIYKVSLCKRPYIYDNRAFIGQWVDGGRLKSRSVGYLLLSALERRLFHDAAGLVVLDSSGERFIRRSFSIENPLYVIPTATDLDKFPTSQTALPSSCKQTTRFVMLGGITHPYLISEVFLFVKQLMLHGHECTIDIVTQGAHAHVHRAAEEAKVPKGKYHVFGVSPRDLPRHLVNYDCGIVFLAEGPWIYMSSPTKVGEYLAAGLHVVGLKGLSVIERLSSQTSCIDVIDRPDPGFENISADIAADIITRVKSPERQFDAQKLAKENYSLNKAIHKYLELYQEVICNNFPC